MMGYSDGNVSMMRRRRRGGGAGAGAGTGAGAGGAGGGGRTYRLRYNVPPHWECPHPTHTNSRYLQLRTDGNEDLLLAQISFGLYMEDDVG